MVAININDRKMCWTDLILNEMKTVETRSVRSLDAFIGEWVGLVRTGGKTAYLVGYIHISERIEYKNSEEFDADYARHWVRSDSALYNNGKKFGYVIDAVERCKIPVPVNDWHPVMEHNGHKLNRYTAREV